LPTAGDIMWVGYEAVGTFNQTGGTVTLGTTTVAVPLYVGFNAAANGTYNLSGGTLTVVNDFEAVGYSGDASFTQSGGTLSVGSLDTNSNPSRFLGNQTTTGWTGGTLSITGAGGLGLGTASATRPLGTTLTLDSTRTLNITNAFAIDSAASFTLNSGTL